MSIINTRKGLFYSNFFDMTMFFLVETSSTHTGNRVMVVRFLLKLANDMMRLYIHGNVIYNVGLSQLVFYE
ncbi:MAG: hypothetical protein B6D58_05830 [candidate division Zixibacteria bacterium 4484_95]|nr:MAG: hypothetical protein B6D58_05830 [candidate division Zixibacteria bacterium 4484_95]RKX18210.1 MAG: hypothetical protein DRP26_05615 [candidate division Zixibacteria bacterium]